MGVPDAAELRARRKYGREGFVQDCLAALVVGGWPPKWNVPTAPTARGVAFLRRLACEAARVAIEPSVAVDFVKECQLPARTPEEESGWPDYGVLWPGGLLLIELKTEAGSHRPGQISYYDALGGYHHSDRSRSIVYVTPPLRTTAKPDPVVFARLHWDRIIDWIGEIWRDAPEDEQRMATFLGDFLRLDQPWESDSDRKPVVPRRQGEAYEGPSLVEMARVTADDGRQRAAEVDWGSPDELEHARVSLRNAVRAEGLPVDPWIWNAQTSGGRALSESGKRLGYELRVSRRSSADRVRPRAEDAGMSEPTVDPTESAAREAFDQLLSDALAADPGTRVEKYRDKLAAYGRIALSSLVPLVGDPAHGAFAVTTIMATERDLGPAEVAGALRRARPAQHDEFTKRVLDQALARVNARARFDAANPAVPAVTFERQDDGLDMLPGFRHHKLQVECDPSGRPLTDLPHLRFDGPKNLRLNPHGRGPFCRLHVESPSRSAGVYAITVERKVMYVGKCVDFAERFGPRGYGAIQPRNCFEGGQSTNCFVNHAVLESVRSRRAVGVWFRETADGPAIEARMIAALQPPWNGEFRTRVPAAAASTDI
jgi:hypothetical protein